MIHLHKDTEFKMTKGFTGVPQYEEDKTFGLGFVFGLIVQWLGHATVNRSIRVRVSVFPFCSSSLKRALKRDHGQTHTVPEVTCTALANNGEISGFEIA